MFACARASIGLGWSAGQNPRTMSIPHKKDEYTDIYIYICIHRTSFD